MRKKRFFIFFYSVAIAVFSLVLAQKTILLISANFALGVLACVYAYFLYKRNNENRKNKLWFAFVLLRVLAVVLLGTVLMVASNPSWAFTFTAGTFALLEGIIEICNHIAVKVRRKRVVQNWN